MAAKKGKPQVIPQTFTWGLSAWTPVREGGVYCSPACGGRCTFAKYQLARKKALALASRLGPSWKALISENLGWHWKVRSGVCEVIEGSNKSFVAYFNGPTQFMGFGDTAEKAVRQALGNARKATDLQLIANAALVQVVQSFPAER